MTLAPLVADLVEIGVADAAEEDFDLHVVFGRIASRDRGGGQRRCRTGGGVGFRLVHGLMLLCGFAFRAWYCSSLTCSIQSTALPSSCFLNGDVRHGRGRRGAVPVLLARREPDHVARPDFLDRAALRCAHPRRPSRSGSGRAGACATRSGAPGSNVTLAPRTRAGSGASNSGSIRTVPVNQSAGPLLEVCEPHLFISIFDL